MTTCVPRLEHLSDVASYVMGVVFILIGVVGIIGNTITLRVFCRPKSRCKTHTQFLLSLVSSDTLSSYILCPVYFIQLLYRPLQVNCSFDITRAYLHVITTATSAISLGVIAFCRYRKLTKVSNKVFGRNTTRVLIALPWIFGLSLPALRFAHVYLYVASVYFVLIGPLVMFTTFYYLISRAMNIQLKHMQEHRQDNKMHNQQQTRDNLRQVQLNRRLFCIIACYIVSILPVSVWMLVQQWNVGSNYFSQNQIQLSYTISMSVGCLNSSLNPLIYALKYPELKKELSRFMAKTIKPKFWFLVIVGISQFKYNII